MNVLLDSLEPVSSPGAEQRDTFARLTQEVEAVRAPLNPVHP
jgi:hypothetical protein